MANATGNVSVDRPLKDIVQSVMHLTANSKMSLQLRRDLEKLCAAASKTKEYEEGK